MAKARAPQLKARWALQDAKNRFSEVVDAALRGHPQLVTRRGVETAVVIAHEDYLRMVGADRDARPPLSEYLLGANRMGAREAFERIRLRARNKI